MKEKAKVCKVCKVKSAMVDSELCLLCNDQRMLEENQISLFD